MEEYIRLLKIDTDSPKYLIQIYQTSFSTSAWAICVSNEGCIPLPRCSYLDGWEIEQTVPGSSKFTQWTIRDDKFYDGIYEVDLLHIKDLRPSPLLLPKANIREYIVFLSKRYRKESIICYLIVSLGLVGVKLNANSDKDIDILLNLLYSKLDT